MATKTKKKRRSHPGLNKTTGRLKKGWKWGKSGNPIKAKKK
jgi:hypothetical protein